MEQFYQCNKMWENYIDSIIKRGYKVEISYFQKERNHWKIEIRKESKEIHLMKINGRHYGENYYVVQVYSPFTHIESESIMKEETKKYEEELQERLLSIINKAESLSFVTKMIIIGDMEKKLNKLKNLTLDELEEFSIEEL